MKHRDNPEIAEQAAFIRGMALAARLAGSASMLLDGAAVSLSKMAAQTCGKGYVGCYGGPECGADHK